MSQIIVTAPKYPVPRMPGSGGLSGTYGGGWDSNTVDVNQGGDASGPEDGSAS